MSKASQPLLNDLEFRQPSVLVMGCEVQVTLSAETALAIILSSAYRNFGLISSPSFLFELCLPAEY
jgi:hypothetical protein